MECIRGGCGGGEQNYNKSERKCQLLLAFKVQIKCKEGSRDSLGSSPKRYQTHLSVANYLARVARPESMWQLRGHQKLEVVNTLTS